MCISLTFITIVQNDFLNVCACMETFELSNPTMVMVVVSQAFVKLSPGCWLTYFQNHNENRKL